MKRSVTTLIATALCGLSLCLIAAPQAHAGAKILFTARASDAPGATAVVDSADGSGLDWDLAGQYEAAYADTEWTIRADGLITVDKGGKNVLATGCWYGDTMTYFFVHSRNGQQTIDGEISRFKSDPSKGYAYLWLTRPSQDGQSWSTVNLYVPLTFAAPQPGTNGGARAGVDM
jgi:hypothetical protein